MLDKKKLLAKDFIIGLLASGIKVNEVAKIIAISKKGMEIRYKNRIDGSWKPSQLKKLRGKILFGKWSWFNHGIMFRQSYDGTVTQDVNFSLSNSDHWREKVKL